ncbi:MULTISPECIES: hypothetical protein [Emticicia]|uniref:hypothetical protein n=1 Tax=Emticicia TaxID=312278 RepID=UPI0012E7CB33|nr:MULTISPECIES: hypothetical protein [Emticicia]
MSGLKIHLFFVFLCHLFCTKAQILIKEKESDQNIPFVELRDSGGRILGMSDENGVILQEVIDKITKIDVSEISFNHISYQTIKLQKQQFLNSKYITLSRNTIVLDEVIVSPTKVNYSFLLVRGYYRTYNIIDTQPKSYADGIVEYLYPNNSKDGILIRRLQERSYLLSTGKAIPTLMNINIVGPRVPDMNLTNENPTKTYNFFDNQNKDYFLLAKHDILKIRKIPLKNGEYAILQEIAYLSPEEKKIIKRFGNEALHEYHNESSVYKTNDSTDISLINLLYHKEIRKFKMKGKNDERFQDVEDIGEFFVEKVEYLQEKPKGFSRFSGFNGVSNYDYKFWEDITNNKLYKPLPDAILNSLNNSLVELKNISR